MTASIDVPVLTKSERYTAGKIEDREAAERAPDMRNGAVTLENQINNAPLWTTDKFAVI